MHSALYDPRATKNPDLLLQNFALARTVRMDLAALEKKITSLGLGEEIEWELRFRGYEVHQAMRKVEAFAMEWLTAHPEYKTLLIDGPEASVASYLDFDDYRGLKRRPQHALGEDLSEHAPNGPQR